MKNIFKNTICILIYCLLLVFFNSTANAGFNFYNSGLSIPYLDIPDGKDTVGGTTYWKAEFTSSSFINAAGEEYVYFVNNVEPKSNVYLNIRETDSSWRYTDSLLVVPSTSLPAYGGASGGYCSLGDVLYSSSAIFKAPTGTYYKYVMYLIHQPMCCIPGSMGGLFASFSNNGIDWVTDPATSAFWEVTYTGCPTVTCFSSHNIIEVEGIGAVTDGSVIKIVYITGEVAEYADSEHETMAYILTSTVASPTSFTRSATQVSEKGIYAPNHPDINFDYKYFINMGMAYDDVNDYFYIGRAMPYGADPFGGSGYPTTCQPSCLTGTSTYPTRIQIYRMGSITSVSNIDTILTGAWEPIVDIGNKGGYKSGVGCSQLELQTGQKNVNLDLETINFLRDGYGNLHSKGEVKVATAHSGYNMTGTDCSVDDVEYFGFVVSARESAGDFIEDVYDYCNFVDVGSASTDPTTRANNDVILIAKAASYGLKTVLHLETLLFNYTLNPDGTVYSVSRRADYTTRWATYASIIAPYIDNILMFMVSDEPYNTGCHTATVPVSEATMKTWLESMPTLIKATFSDAKLGQVYAYPSMLTGYSTNPATSRNTSFEIPDGYDYVGFIMLYPSFRASGYYSATKHAGFEADYHTIGSYFLDEVSYYHKLIVVPGSFYYNSTPVPQSELVEDGEFFVELAENDDTIKVVAPFLYATYDGKTGVENLSTVRTYWQTAGPELLHKKDTFHEGVYRFKLSDCDYNSGIDFTQYSSCMGAWYMVSNYSPSYPAYEPDQSGEGGILYNPSTISNSSTVPYNYSGTSRLWNATECLWHEDGKSTDISGSTMSFFAWIKFTSDPSDQATVVAKWSTLAGQWQYSFMHYHAANAMVAFISNDGSSVTYAQGATDLADDTDWHHVGFVVDGSNITVYVDGWVDSNGALNPKAYSGGIFNGNDNFTIGCASDQSREPFPGYIDDVIIFDTALTPTEVYELYYRGTSGNKGGDD